MLACALVVLCTTNPSAAQQPSPAPQSAEKPSAGGVQPAEPRFRALRSVSGTQGEEQDGRYIVHDPRTIFHLPHDRQVIVYFEWEGPPGHHRFEGLWKNPEGKIAVISNFEYEAKQSRFAGYWTLLLSDTTPTGLWALEARIDGELAGTHVFQILSTGEPPPMPEPPPQPPSPSEIYERLKSATVFIEKLDAEGMRAGIGSGFYTGEFEVATAFQVIDGAHRLRVILPGGQSVEVQEILAWNRRQDWAVLKLPVKAPARLPRAENQTRKVGDFCYSLDSPSDGVRTITSGYIVGEQSQPGSGPRLNVSFMPFRRAVGSPLVNEFGKVIGMLGGWLVPGILHAGGVGMIYRAPSDGDLVTQALVVPIELIPDTSAGLTVYTLKQMTEAGHFIPLLHQFEGILGATLAKQLDKTGEVIRPMETGTEFSRREGTFYLHATLRPTEKSKGKQIALLHFYDLDNRLAVKTKPTELKLRKDQVTFLTWPIDAALFRAGIYRVDLLINEQPVWRAFIRLRD